MTLYAKKASYINNKVRFKAKHISMYYNSGDMCIWAKNFNIDFFKFNVIKYHSEHILRRVIIYLFHLKASIFSRQTNISEEFMKYIDKYDFYLDSNVQELTLGLFKI